MQCAFRLLFSIVLGIFCALVHKMRYINALLHYIFRASVQKGLQIKIINHVFEKTMDQ